MELIRGLHNLRPRHRGNVVTIGNFDGVHLGHQAVLGQVTDKAVELKLPSAVITFEPQPQEYFAPEAIPPRLTRMREKYLALHRYGVDRMLSLKFNEELAAMSARAFIQRILIDGLGVQYLVVGDDFRFGCGREGDFKLLQEASKQYGFELASTHTFAVDESRVSSTRVREALVAADLNEASVLLGRHYRMCGRVAHGNKLGRTIGFPTANIYLHRMATPVQGVYAVEVFGLEGEPVRGVANVGTRPTVGGTRSLLEVHLFDYSADIYGRHVQVDFLYRIRPECRFDSLEALKAQIAKDVTAARTYFAGH